MPTCRSVAIEMRFYLNHHDLPQSPLRWNRKLNRWQKTCSNPPDLTNLEKAAEDALEGVVFVNDVQVRIKRGASVSAASVPGVVISVHTIDMSPPESEENLP